MEAKDLMIGDWVYNKHHKKYICITPYDFFTHGHLPSGRQYFIEEPKVVSGRDLEPIPLTSEILEKNGFEKSMQVSDTEPYDMDEEGNMHFSYNTVFWGWWQSNNILCIPANGLGWLNIKYVHELQHALRLCGIEKEIEL